MRGPQNLLAVWHVDKLKGLLARVIYGKALVAARMPVGRKHHGESVFYESIDRSNDFVALRHWQSTARQKIVLNIHHDQSSRGILQKAHEFLLASLAVRIAQERQW